jgi:hypothetical protein
MIFVDTNVFIYAVGGAHPLRDQARDFFLTVTRRGDRLCTSAAVLQELIHVYLPVRRMETLDAALELAARVVGTILPIDADAVMHARDLADQYPGLTTRDLLHLAVCRIHKATAVKTFDRGLQAAFPSA